MSTLSEASLINLNNTTSTIVSFVVGFLASLLSWYFVTKLIRPKINISDKILLSPSTFDESEIVAKIIVENESRFSAFEFNMKGRIFLYGLHKEYPDIPTLFIINVGNGNHPYLARKKVGLKEEVSGRNFRISMKKDTKKKLAHYIIDLETGKEPTIVDFLNLDHRNFIEVSIFCSHGFSFTRGLKSRKYHSGDVDKGFFSNHGVSVNKSLTTINYEHTQELDSKIIEDAED